jgi:glutamine cyclotransferase
MKRGLVALAAGGGLAAALLARSPHAEPRAPEFLRVKVVRSFPHDPGAFTQGLVFHAGWLYESTGLSGRSSLRRVDPASGRVEAQVPLPAPLFGEGLAETDGRLVQLTWTDGRAFVWNADSLTLEGEWTYAGQGWGLCSTGSDLLMSDGSDRLARRDPRTFAVVGSVSVRSPAGPVYRLNELECVGETVYANIWQTSRIARIDARTGHVTAWIDAAGLLTEDEASAADVLNGIAYLPSSGRFVVTGKLWPRAFEVEFVSRTGRSRRRGAE